MSLDALLLDNYSNIALCIAKKPKTMSRKNHTTNMKKKIEKAKEAGITLVFIRDFEDFDTLKNLLDSLIS